MGTFVHTTLYGQKALLNIVKQRILGTNAKPLGSQIPQFRNRPLSFCSFLCDGYPEAYGDREGIAFETDIRPAYACPTDTFNLMRSAHWLPGHDQFIFPSLDELLKAFPTNRDFKAAFQAYFISLQPREVYPSEHLSDEWAEREYRRDYCLDPSFYPPWNSGCNEIAFPKPLQIKNCRIFRSKDELMIS